MTSIRAGRRDVEISRPDKELFPGITKLDLAGYYADIADTMLPLVADRPLNLERYPDGIGGNKIFQQHASKHFPDWVKRVETPKSGGTVQHVVANDAATLVYLANQGVITLHAWLSRARPARPARPARRRPRPERRGPRRDAQGGDRRRRPVRGARAAAVGDDQRLAGLSRRRSRWRRRARLRRRCATFARDFATLAERRHRELFTTEQRKAKREGKILLDVARNKFGTTSVAPYSVRARPECSRRDAARARRAVRQRHPAEPLDDQERSRAAGQARQPVARHRQARPVARRGAATSWMPR